MGASTHPQPQVADEVERRLVDLLYQNALVGLVVSLVTGALLAYVNMVTHVSPAPATGWWAGLSVLALGRYALSRKYQRTAAGDRQVVAWRRAYIVATAMVALAWGLGSAAFMWGAPMARAFSPGC